MGRTAAVKGRFKEPSAEDVALWILAHGNDMVPCAICKRPVNIRFTVHDDCLPLGVKLPKGYPTSDWWFRHWKLWAKHLDKPFFEHVTGALAK